jgi:hypothetical protein
MPLRQDRCLPRRAALTVAIRPVLVSLLLGLGMSCASAQSEGGLYVAGDGFSFQVAAQRALSQNPRGARFFLLSLPPETVALRASMTGRTATLRQQVVAANGVLLVCRRDIDAGRVDPEALVAGVVAVRGWSTAGSPALPAGQRYFADEDATQLPRADNALRRLRSACS